MRREMTDLYKSIAAKAEGITVEDVTPEQRRLAKRVCWASNYSAFPPSVDDYVKAYQFGKVFFGLE